MRASEIRNHLFCLSLTGVLVGFGGCRGNLSDRTVRVSKAPGSSQSPAEPVPSRLASGLPQEPSSDPDLAKPVTGTDASESSVRQANRLEPAGMIGSEEGIDETRLMAAFEHADPQVQAIAKRQYQASMARAQTAPPRSSANAEPAAASPAPANPVPANPAPANPAPANAGPTKPAPPKPGPAPAGSASRLASTPAAMSDAAIDRDVPTLPGSAQRVAEAQPDPGPLPDSLPPETTAAVAAKPGAAAAADVVTASRSRDQGAARAAAAEASSADEATAQDAAKAGTSEGEEASEAASFEERLATLDEQRLYALLIDRYQAAEDGESEAAGLRRRIHHRLLLMMAGRIDEAVEPLDGLAPSEQEYLRHQLLTLWTAIDPQGHPVSQRRWTSALPHLREATSYLAAATGKLDVRSLAFCTEVISFGRVKPFETDRFQAGQEVILYSEVDCFAAERLSDGYETHFNASFEIYDADGKRVADKILPADRQAGKNYRRDYFIAYRMHLPSHLDPGSYRLELTIEDLKGQKYGSSSIPFQVEAKAPAN